MSVKLLLVMVMVTVVSLATAVTTKTYRKRRLQQAQGEVIVSTKVESPIQCGGVCGPSECVGYNLINSSNSLQCTTFSRVDNFTQNDDCNYFCTGCRYKGESCSTSEECATAIPHTICDSGACVCEEAFDDDGEFCKFNFTSGGFVVYNGRWMMPPACGFVSWMNVRQYCLERSSVMHRPRDLAEWNYMVSHLLDYPLYPLSSFPINDLDEEGTIVWNDGTGVNEDFIKWAFGKEGSGNLEVFDCVMMIPFIPLTDSYIYFAGCNIAFLQCWLCEAPQT